MPGSALKVWTIGHSTRSIEEFVDLLRGHGIQRLADVRSFPGSRRFPQFNRDALASELARAGTAYVHLPELGGLRKPLSDSANTAWKNDSFRGYADHMQTPEFQQGLQQLERLAAEMPTAVMCSEAVWWRCHRSLIADALKVRGAKVLHIMSVEAPQEHPYTSAARVEAGRLLYDGEPHPGVFARESQSERGA